MEKQELFNKKETGWKNISNENKENIIFESNRILTTPKHYAYLKISQMKIKKIYLNFQMNIFTF